MSTSRTATSLFQTLPLRTRSTSQYICAPCLRQQQRSIHKTKQLTVPEPTPFVPDVKTFLTLIGRGLSAQAGKITTWRKLFTLSSDEFRELGIEPVRSRRYLLRWREKFRNGQFGAGGDFKFVKDGTAVLRVVEVPSLESAGEQFVSVNNTPGKTKLVLNVPEGFDAKDLKPLLGPGQTAKDLKKPREYQLRNGFVIAGPYAEPMAGHGSSAVRVKVQEGMWEDPLGKKVFGGERRRAETLHKLGVAEHRKAIGAAR